MGVLFSYTHLVLLVSYVSAIGWIGCVLRFLNNGFEDYCMMSSTNRGLEFLRSCPAFALSLSPFVSWDSAYVEGTSADVEDATIEYFIASS